MAEMDKANSAENDLRLTDRQLIEAERFIKDNAALCGLVRGINTKHDGHALPLDLAVLPALLPAACHRFAIDLQSHWLALVHRLSSDDRFLERTLERVAAVDSLVAHQMHVYRETRQESLQQLSLCLLRIDYMNAEDGMKLVEITCTAVGMIGWTAPLALLRSRLTANVELPPHCGTCVADVDSAKMFSDALATTYKHYRERFGRSTDTPPVILTIVGPDETFSDLTPIALPMIIYRRIEQVTRDCHVSDEGILFLGTLEVAVVYFYVGTSDFEGHWDTRLLLERSLAVKCPSMRQTLVGMKTVQQILSQPNVIEHYASNAAAAQQLRRTFVGHFPLSDHKAVERALKQPHRFVLKPNRDGGGNNFYKDALRTKLESIVGRSEAQAYTLMQRIEAPTQHNVLVFGDHERQSLSGPTVNEFSYFGVLLCTGSGEVLYEKVAQQPVARSKRADMEEASIRTGYAAPNTVALV